MTEPGPPIANSIGGYTEAEIAQLPTGERWYNPTTNRVEPLSTSQHYADAQRLASEARQRFVDRQGYDRMRGEPDVPLEEFETAPSTPMRAGPGLGVSPMNVASGVGAGLALVVGGAGIAMANKQGNPVKITADVPKPPTSMSPPVTFPKPTTPSLMPVKDEVQGHVPYSFPPLVGLAMPNVVGRRRRRRRRKSQFLSVFQ
jgi:hypothetical protein